MKKIISLFCLIVLCIQVLPVKQIGAILFNNQVTEEIAHAAETVKKPVVEKPDNCLTAFLNHHISTSRDTNSYNIFSKDALVKLHVAEVPTPPPNLM